MRLLAIGIGDPGSADRFCAFTGFLVPVYRWSLIIVCMLSSVYAGLQAPGGPWPNLLLMCAGIDLPARWPKCSVVTRVIAQHRRG